MSFQATNTVYSDQIITRFIYGQDNVPTDLINESLIGRGEPSHLSISRADFMAGPGRFANPAFFEVLQQFFRLSNADLLAKLVAQGVDLTPQADGSVEISKTTMIKALIDDRKGGLAFAQAYFDDGQGITVTGAKTQAKGGKYLGVIAPVTVITGNHRPLAPPR